MSLHIASLVKPDTEYTREQLLALRAPIVFNDGRTKQCHADECNINKIMARFDKTGTISHLAKYQPVYADYSDFDFHEQTTKLTKGREIFDDLPAEVRREFGQSPAAFFKFVNSAENIEELSTRLPLLAKPGTQLPQVSSPTADNDRARADADKAAPPGPEPADASAGPSPGPSPAAAAAE